MNIDYNNLNRSIQVNGYSEKGNRIKRLLSTSLNVLDGLPPEVLVNATNLNINEGESTALMCTVHSLVPCTVRIEHGEKLLKELQSK